MMLNISIIARADRYSDSESDIASGKIDEADHGSSLLTGMNTNVLFNMKKTQVSSGVNQIL